MSSTKTIPKFNTIKKDNNKYSIICNINKQPKNKDLCYDQVYVYFSTAYIFVRRTIPVQRDIDTHNTKLVLKNYILFISNIPKLKNTIIDKSKDWEIVMPSMI